MTDSDHSHVVLEIPRGEENVLRLTRKVFEGKTFTDLRVFFMNGDGDFVPTRKGVSIRDHELPQVLDMLQRIARKVAQGGR